MILGIDIGNHGALALLTRNGQLNVFDMPLLGDGPRGRPTLNAPLLWALFCRIRREQIEPLLAARIELDIVAYVEDVGYIPTDGGQGAFAFGQCKGMVKMALAAASIPAIFVTAAKWKRAMGLLKAGKEASRSEAIRRWPGNASLFERVKDDGRAEAALIAAYGLGLQPMSS